MPAARTATSSSALWPKRAWLAATTSRLAGGIIHGPIFVIICSSGPQMSYRTLAEAMLAGRPYFGPALCAMQGVPERHQYFLPTVIEVARRREGPSLDVLEIGSWAGASAVTWAMALREAGASGTVTCVDPWLPYFDVEAEHRSEERRVGKECRSRGSP